MNLEQVLNFVDENFKEIDISSVVVSEKKSKTKKPNPLPPVRKSESCHLIGKVNPNILRTWEQLNLCQSNDSEAEAFCNQDEELGPFQVNYVTYEKRKKRTTDRSASQDDLYYDSIDENEDDTLNLQPGNVGTLSSGTGESVIYRGQSLMTDSTDALLQAAEEEGQLGPRGGEGMAEFDSLDRKRFKCWSLEEENDPAEAQVF